MRFSICFSDRLKLKCLEETLEEPAFHFHLEVQDSGFNKQTLETGEGDEDSNNSLMRVKVCLILFISLMVEELDEGPG